MLRHSCTIIHCIRYVFSYLNKNAERKKSLAPDKSFRKTFEEKEGNFKQIGVFKEAQIPTELDLKSVRIGLRGVSPIK